MKTVYGDGTQRLYTETLHRDLTQRPYIETPSNAARILGARTVYTNQT